MQPWTLSYWGPKNFFELNRPPVRAKIKMHGLVEADAARLFDTSEKLTGVTFPKHSA